MTCTSGKSMNYLPWFPSLSLCLRCAMSDYMGVAMQRRCEKYIVLAPKFNNIIVSTAAHSIVMLCHGVAVAVFPTYMGVYVTCLFLPTHEPAGAARSRMCLYSCSAVSFHHCIPNYTIATFTFLCVEKTWLQKKEKIYTCDFVFIVFV